MYEITRLDNKHKQNSKIIFIVKSKTYLSISVGDVHVFYLFCRFRSIYFWGVCVLDMDEYVCFDDKIYLILIPAGLLFYRERFINTLFREDLIANWYTTGNFQNCEILKKQIANHIGMAKQAANCNRLWPWKLYTTLQNVFGKQPDCLSITNFSIYMDFGAEFRVRWYHVVIYIIEAD